MFCFFFCRKWLHVLMTECGLFFHLFGNSHTKSEYIFMRTKPNAMFLGENFILMNGFENGPWKIEWLFFFDVTEWNLEFYNIDSYAFNINIWIQNIITWFTRLMLLNRNYFEKLASSVCVCGKINAETSNIFFHFFSLVWVKIREFLFAWSLNYLTILFCISSFSPVCPDFSGKHCVEF